jgi:colanic acid biosynthesis glycosyl transferase WcaI
VREAERFDPPTTRGTVRIVISDYSGHPFQVQLARELARRGHQVLHLHFAEFQTPKGNLTRDDDDPDDFAIKAVSLNRPFAKNSFFHRRAQEIEVGRLIGAEIEAFAPELVVSSNAPLDTQRFIQNATRKADANFVFWLQDIYSKAIGDVVMRKLPGFGHAVAAWYRYLEGRLLRGSDRIVAIAEQFREALAPWGISNEKIAVIENWAPLDEIPSLPRDNPWANANFAPGRLRLVYSGTLGYKHNPHWLPALARAFPHVDVCVFSEGAAADQLASEAAEEGLANLSIRSWVPFADLPSMLAGADLFVAFIEAEAGVYSVPSKILTYLAAGRPILAALPGANLAASIIVDNNAGFVSGCDSTEDFLANAAMLIGNAALRAEQGGNGREYALRTFDIGRIGDRFLAAVAGQVTQGGRL